MLASLSLKKIWPLLNFRASAIVGRYLSGWVNGRSIESYPYQQQFLSLRITNNVATDSPCSTHRAVSFALRNPIQNIYFPELNSDALTEVIGSNDDGYSCLSVVKQRRKKMKKHKYRKWRKKMKFVRKAQGR